MVFCPNCSHIVEADATSCERCGAEFGPSTAWKPVAEPLSSSGPAVSEPQKKWIGVYVLLWFLSFAAFCAMSSADKSLDAQKLGTFGFLLLNAANSLWPWFMSFAIGLLFSGISIWAFRPDPGRRGVFWKRALVIAWAPAFFFLYVGWKAEGYRERNEKELGSKIAEIRNRLSQRALADKLQLAAEFEKLDVPSILAVDSLISRPGIARNDAKLAQLAMLVDRQEALSRSNLSELQRQMNELISGQSDGRDLRRSLDAALTARAELEAKILDNQRRLIEVLASANDFMRSRLGRVFAQAGLIRFETEDEAKKYNAYVQEVMTLARTEADLLAQLQRIVDDGTKTFDQTFDQLTR